MKQTNTKYVVKNAFSNTCELKRKEKINKIIRTLCILDIENCLQLESNIDIEFHSSVSNLNEGGTLKC